MSSNPPNTHSNESPNPYNNANSADRFVLPVGLAEHLLALIQDIQLKLDHLSSRVKAVEDRHYTLDKWAGLDRKEGE